MSLNLDNSFGGLGEMSPGWSFDGFAADTVQAGAGTTSTSGGVFSGLWDGAKDFLNDGLNVWQDYLQVEQQAKQIEHTNSPPPTQWTEASIPVDTAPVEPVLQPATSQWVTGVPNHYLAIGGIGLVLLLIVGGRR